jgi:phenylpropionate dioxygenase-like ring-hydroxylating dioxygenase large terminal subunit
MSADADGPGPGADVKRKAPRGPGMQFVDFVRGYKKHPVPDYLLIDKSEWFGDEDISVDRYLSREIHDLEKEKIWKKAWQMACREEEIPEVGDATVYEITDMSILVVRSAKTEIKAYFNVCLHQGRALRDGPSHGMELRCPFHGFCWTLKGRLAHVPSQWDFPQLDKSKFSLREVKVGTWGGFIFINMDLNCESLESFLGDMPMHWEKFPLEERYTAAHVAKIFPANWKVAQEAFMEAYHVRMTHPQFAIYTASATENEQYDAFGNYSRGLGQGSSDIPIAFAPTPEERLATYVPLGHPEVYARVREAGPVADMMTQFEQHAATRREVLREFLGAKVDELSDFEVYGGGYFTLFPNFHPWWAFDEITYRFRPYKDDPEMCIMETYLLRPFKGERPKPVPIHWLGVDESFVDAPELGGLAQIFNQDEFNIPAVQKGMHNLKAIGKGITLGVYQGTKIRHFHRLWEKWMYGKAPQSPQE